MKQPMCITFLFVSLQYLLLTSHLELCHSQCIEAENTWVKYDDRVDGRNYRATCAIRITPGDCSPSDKNKNKNKNKKRGTVFFLDHYPTTYFQWLPDDPDPYVYGVYNEPEDNDDAYYHYDYTLSAYTPFFSHGYYYESYHDELFSTAYARCTQIVNPQLVCDGPHSTRLEFDSIETELRVLRPQKSLRVDQKRLLFQSRFVSRSAAASGAFKGSNAIPDCSAEDTVKLCGRMYDKNITLRIRSLECSSVPTEIGLMKNLKLLDLKFSRAKVKGLLPTEIGNLEELAVLRLSKLSNPNLPSQIGLLKNLKHLEITFKTPGTLTSYIGQLVSLTELNSPRKSLKGSLPTQIGNLVNLESMSLNKNLLTGRLPTELGNLVSTSINLAENRFTGGLPPELARLRGGLSLQHNKLNGTVPSEFVESSSSLSLGLRNNTIEGFPFGLITSQSRLGIDLSENKITGQISGELFKMKNSRLVLKGNRMSGPLPAPRGDLAGSRLDLGDNQINGPVPPGLSKLKGTLALTGNQLSGTVPSQLGRLQGDLELGGNRLTGTVPTELARLKHKLVLQGNSMTGTVPSELGQLRFGELDLSDNCLTGSLPSELAQIRDAQLDLTGNKLTGFLPEEFDDLDYGGSYVSWEYNDIQTRDPTAFPSAAPSMQPPTTPTPFPVTVPTAQV